LLLTLLCFVFEAIADFPSNRAQLYREGLDVMLKKWDASRDVDRDIIYKNLSPNRKEDLLSQIAWTTFEGGKYFFEQDLAKKYIADYIINLPEAQTDPEALLVDSEAVLKSIECQHGLLVERAKYIYSFSHLSFQEYFAARRAIATDKTLSSIVIHTDDRRWREVFLLAFGILQDGSELLRLMKQQIDNLVAADKKIQQILVWGNNKYASIDVPYQPAAIKSLYIFYSLRDTHHRCFELSLKLDPRLMSVLESECKYDLYLNIKDGKNLESYLNLTSILSIVLIMEYTELYLYLYIDLYINEIIDFQLKEELHKLEKQIPDRKDYNNLEDWWR